jgi:hypothetical protein
MRACRDKRFRIDRNLLVDLASRAHQNARKEFVEFLADVEAGRFVRI